MFSAPTHAPGCLSRDCVRIGEEKNKDRKKDKDLEFRFRRASGSGMIRGR